MKLNGTSFVATIPAMKNTRWFLSNLIAYTGAANFHWICMGDLNKILDQSKKKGGLPISIWATRLWDFMDDSQAMDLGSEGLSFIWTNKRKGRHNIRQIIDRVLIYVDWFHFFSFSYGKKLKIFYFRPCSHPSYIKWVY